MPAIVALYKKEEAIGNKITGKNRIDFCRRQEPIVPIFHACRILWKIYGSPPAIFRPPRVVGEVENATDEFVG